MKVYHGKNNLVSATECLVTQGLDENSVTRNDILVIVIEKIHLYKNSVETTEHKLTV